MDNSKLTVKHNEGVAKAVDLLGYKILQLEFNVKRQHVYAWKSGRADLPLFYALQVEKMTNGQVTRRELNSKINWDLLEELISAKYAQPKNK